MLYPKVLLLFSLSAAGVTFKCGQVVALISRGEDEAGKGQSSA